MERHPFLKGLSRHRGAPPTLMVIFGASGDLTSRKLVPAIYNLALDNLLPPQFHLVGFGRKEIPDEDFRKDCEADLAKFSRRPVDRTIWGSLRERLHYLAGGYDDAGAFTRLRSLLADLEQKAGRPTQHLFYVSTPPSVFPAVLDNLGESGLAAHSHEGELASRVIIEKPFGYDLASAKALNQRITRHFREDQVFRIDHYLGKETVQNLMVQRFANAIFEPIWKRNYVQSVSITVAESVGVGSRAGYYDHSGALRDMIQNHTMQLLSLVAMEPPVSLDPEAIRDEKVKVLTAVQPLNVGLGEGCDVVRGRYVSGAVNGEEVPGYLDEEDIPSDSTTETFVAMRVNINNWRWQGVPFYLRSGKRLPRRVSEIAIRFRRPPGVLFSGSEQFDLGDNTLVIQVQPDEGTTLLVNSKVPGLETRTQPVKLHFRYKATFGSNTPEAYERLILDAMMGDSTLFIRGDETEQAWRIVTPILEQWKRQGREGLNDYVAGSWGPGEADTLVRANGDEWRRP